MVYKEYMYGITCDNCHKQYENLDGYSLFTDVDSARDAAQTDGWEISTDKHYCPECYKNLKIE